MAACVTLTFTLVNSLGVQHGLGYTVVSNLCQHIKGKWYCVFFDNFFTSCKLIEDLYSDKILCCGTVRQGQKEFPPVLFDKDTIKNLPHGDAMWRMKGPILHVLWMDKKAVWVAGTATSAPPAVLPEVQRRARDGTLQSVKVHGRGRQERPDEIVLSDFCFWEKVVDKAVV